MRPRVLLAMPTGAFAQKLVEILEPRDAIVATVGSRRSLWPTLRNQVFDFILIDRSFLGDSAAEQLSRIHELPEHPSVVVMGTAVDPAERARLHAAGGTATLDSEVEPEILQRTLEILLENRRQEMLRTIGLERVRPRHRLDDFAASSPAMKRLLGMARRLVHADSSLLVLGETGVGKEWLSRAMHEEGPRSAGPFVAVNCGAVPEALLESELFGHERGAFTGAVRAHRGYFEMAHGGTLFLDEIGEMPTHLQVKILRTLDERAVQPVGSETKTQVDVRIIAATNRDPMDEMRAGRLRRDLYYRLGVVNLTLPPLRERREDIAALALTYLESFGKRFGRDIGGFEPEALEVMRRYPWPGNVRELMNVVERAVLLTKGREILVEDLPEDMRRPQPKPDGVSPARSPEESTGPAKPQAWVFPDGELPPLREARRSALLAFEKAYLSEALSRSGGRVGETALRVGIDPRSLYAKMRRCGLKKEDFRFSPPA